jgi:hypothetical protein
MFQLLFGPPRRVTARQLGAYFGSFGDDFFAGEHDDAPPASNPDVPESCPTKGRLLHAKGPGGPALTQDEMPGIAGEGQEIGPFRCFVEAQEALDRRLSQAAWQSIHDVGTAISGGAALYRLRGSAAARWGIAAIDPEPRRSCGTVRDGVSTGTRAENPMPRGKCGFRADGGAVDGDGFEQQGAIVACARHGGRCGAGRQSPSPEPRPSPGGGWRCRPAPGVRCGRTRAPAP